MPSWTSDDLKAYEQRRHSPRIKIPDSESCERAKALARDSFRKAQGTVCPLVRFTLCRVKLLDVDAKYASVKDLLDGLAAAGLIHGDKEGQVRLEVNQVKVGHYEDERTEIHVEINNYE